MSDETRQEGEKKEHISPASQAIKNKKHYIHWVAGAVFLFLLISILGALWVWIYGSTPIRSASSPDIIVDIPPGSGLSGIQRSLQRNGVIDSDVRFLVLAHFMGVSRQLQAGEYRFTAEQTPKDVLRLLHRGKVVQWPVTIPEGTNVYQIAEILNTTVGVDKEKFFETIRSKKLISSLGLEVLSLEGYLFPDTYLLPKGKTPESIVSMMVARFLTVYKDAIGEGGQNDIFQPPLNQHQVVTLASIVEEETGIAEERPLVAAVFLNRLQKKMPLQADPTVMYGLKKFDEPLTKKDLKTKTGYNTYLKKGLPAGPISNPGRDSLMAVLHPAQTPYLYFVSKNDGTHQFSRTLKEHNRAVQRYQR
jgi:UPF0755 protein